jgi:hypothetical protein
MYSDLLKSFHLLAGLMLCSFSSTVIAGHPLVEDSSSVFNLSSENRINHIFELLENQDQLSFSHTNRQFNQEYQVYRNGLSGDLYKSIHWLPLDLAELQKRFYFDSFRYYKNLLVQKIPHHKIEILLIPPPEFQLAASRNEWIYIFENQVKLYFSQAEDQVSDSQTQLRKIFFSHYQGETFARVPYQTYEHIEHSKNPLQFDGWTEHSLIVPTIYPQEKHTLDIEEYVNERFPSSLRAFLLRKNVPLYIHNGSCEEATQYHSIKGFSEAYRFLQSREASVSPHLFLRNRTDNSYRFIICPNLGNDRAVRVLQILGPYLNAGAFMVSHVDPAKIFEWSENAAQIMQMDPKKDLVIIGFKNTVWNYLNEIEPDQWEQVQLTNHGTDVALYINQVTKKRIISMWNPYGDETSHALDAFYARGARRFVFLGSTGALGDSFNVGDVVTPTRFYNENQNTWFDFKNQLADGAEFKKVGQGWIQTLIEETLARIIHLKEMGVESLDIESKYFAEFFQDHPAEAGVILLVSDTPLGQHVFTEENVNRSAGKNTMKSVLKAVLK